VTRSRSTSRPKRLYAGFARALRPGGLLALQEPMAGPLQPVVFPVMWAREAGSSFLRAPAEMRRVIEAAGFSVRLVMGDAPDAIVQAGRRNHEEGRIVMIQAVREQR
jgi:hypothetical protein